MINPNRHSTKGNLTRREMLAVTGAGLIGILAGNAPGTARFATQDGRAVIPYLQEQWELLRDTYFVTTLQFNPVTSSYLGGDGYSDALLNTEGRLRDYSPSGLDIEVRFYRILRERMGKIDPGGLSPDAQVDYQVMGAHLNFLLRQTETLRNHERAVETYVIEPVNGVNYQLQQMESLSYGQLGTREEWEQVLRRISAIPTYLSVAQANLSRGKAEGNLPDRRMVQFDGIDGSRDAIEFFQTDLPQQAQVFLGSRPFAASVLARLGQAGADAARAYQAFIDFLNRTYDPNETVDRYAIGAADYEWRVRNNFRVALSAAEIYDYGAGQVAQYEGQIFAVAEQIAAENGLGLPFGTEAEKRASTRQVLVYLNQDSPQSDDQLFAWYRQIGQDAVAYGRAQGLFEIPADYRLDVVETPPVLQSGILAAYNPAPPFKPGAVGQFYVTPTGNDPAKLRESSRGFMTNIAVHEGFPGHDWHYKFMSAHLGEIANLRWLTPGAVQDTSSMWSDSMPAEGWAHYAEQLVSEPAPGLPYGFYSLNNYLYFLHAALFRAVRVRVDAGLHAAGLGFDEAVDYFTAHYSFYPGACAQSAVDPAAAAVCALARREIYRYSKWPTQAITYNLGKQALLELRTAFQAKMGARYSEQAFHEKVFRQGTIAPGFYRDQFLSS